ncbi:hypothetical protein MATR_19340 [Marivirga tractuosa]|uniref:Uncharacterized protein n=1 Tax=Marivirga tractuosa (strain ATCC 23168 / DSM 4126 / NBRC 15989 / NCIMB 1408 / VKM B-1430 / H-43) TaxID=643867 RepID=E4TNI9_MARTH|nr:DUF4221 family protein [Marivirga tractuosa]ADR20446.1 hypothetical protein Ftrac_0440 [Marivirga tractuosa DSM 4126]BDD15109.1 hypothetical protein MATR_19340 [Marivirga tractuosa]
MKNLLMLLISSMVFWSCESSESKESKSAYYDFELEIDTVQVDPGKEILMAGAYTNNSAVSTDKTKFYNWDRNNYALEVIDIEKYRLKDKIYFEKDGPKGLQSDYLFSTKSLPNNRFGFEDNSSFKIHDVQGNLFKKVVFEEEWIKNGLQELESFELVNVNDEGTALAGIHFGFDQYKAMMFILDIEEQKKKSIPLPKFQRLENYKIVLHRNETYLTSVNPKIFIDFLGDSMLISNNHFNGTYIYKSDQLTHKSFEHRLIPEGKEKIYKKRSESREEVVQTVFDMNEEVSFTRFLFDEKKNKFYRFSNQAKYAEGSDEPTWEVSMMVYDQELDLIGEKEIMTFDNYAEPLFVKDSKVHFHLNMEDELGFIRIGLKK